MTENTKIEWADHTFNPWLGCTKVSPGCDRCYAESWAKRTGDPQLWQGARRRTTIEYWQQPFRWNDRAKAAGVRARVFCASLADVFDNLVSNHWRWDLFAMIRATPHLDWLLLTKRIGNARQMLNQASDAALDAIPGTNTWDRDPWSNVWLGATYVDQDELDRDLLKHLATPARLRFISYEPALGPLNIGLLGTLPASQFPGYQMVYQRLHWVIAGGESGGGARPMHPAWVRALRDECASAGVPFLFKQWGEWAPLEVLPDLSGKRLDVQLNGYTAVRAGKKLAGRVLDGRTWDQFPTAVA